MCVTNSYSSFVFTFTEKIFDNYGNDMDNISMHKLRHPKTGKIFLHVHLSLY